ncbi:hypothetical protein FHS31_001469 [Sphingomonas vulcanisoli]|uniref:HEAT repeat domain-containing protein n=1 Tax=Sphingomonas vulcanisoli TaxID=1658060 RepID=A0ABX0TSY5_9SPHN|nr:hypothetical protein [Sphingomonas vulcanisoli]
MGEDFARALEAEPAIAALRAALKGGGDAIVAVRPVLEDLGWLDRSFARLIAASRADPLFEPPLQPIGQAPREGVRLFANPRLAISLLRLPSPRETAGTIGFSGQALLVRFLGCAPTVRLWGLDDGRCRFAGERRIGAGELLLIDGVSEAWSIAPGSKPAILVQATTRESGVPLATYDVASGALVARTATDSAAMRMQLIASLLCRMERHDAAPALRAAAGAGPPHLRWHIARELTAMAPDQARPLLDRMALADPHADVRAAARRTLALLAA